MTIARQEMARRAEQHVARHLEGQGFRIVGMNVRAGRLELDVVAERAGLLVVCEVRARTSDRFGSPGETISHVKIARVREAVRLRAAPDARVRRGDAVASAPSGPCTSLLRL